MVIDTKVTGICGSDLHAYYGEWPQSPGEAAGHETCGVVVEVGEGVEHVQEGDRVVMEVTSNCGRCLYCRKGQYNHCVKKHVSWKGGHGGFAEYTNVHASTVFQLSDDITYRQGALVEPLAVLLPGGSCAPNRATRTAWPSSGVARLPAHAGPRPRPRGYGRR